MKDLSRFSTNIEKWLRAFTQSAVVIIFAVWMNNIFLVKGDDCRLLQFKPQTKSKALQNHVIRKFKVPHQSKCELSCYLEPNCVSYNYGPERGISLTQSCELSDRSHLQVSSEDFVSKESYIYREALNSKCHSNPCQNNGTCQAGFTVKEYRCICHQQYTGDYCEADADECDLGIHTCSLHALCVNIPGSFQCHCKIGYAGDGLNCTAVPLTCVSITHSAATNSYEVNADHTTTHALCRFIRMEEVNAGYPYTLTVDLFNVIGSGRVNFGHPGVMYNVIDGNNFDFVYFRPHNANSCYQIGHLLNGNFGNSRSGRCPNGPPPGANWFTVRLVVGSDKTVNIFLNNALVTTQVAHFDTRGHGGVFVFNRYQNIIKFRAFSITTTQ